MKFNPNDNFKDYMRVIKESDAFGINFVGKTVCDSNFHVKRNFSKIMSFEYIVSGKGTLKINSQTFYPEKGDVFLLTEGTDQEYYVDKNDPWIKYFYSFTGPLAVKLKELYLPCNTYIFKNCDLIDSFEKILDIGFDENKSYEEICDEILIETVKVMLYLNKRTKSNKLDLFEIIKDKIDRLVEGEFSLENISNDLNYSKNHIINVFKEAYNMTPYQYYLDSKIGIAKRYLTQTSSSVLEIAESLSFSDSRYFSVWFKKYTGMTPREYRIKSKL